MRGLCCHLATCICAVLLQAVSTVSLIPLCNPAAWLCGVLQVQAGASTVLGPILERSAKAERIRSVQLLMRRFQGLFSAPQRIRGLAAARDYEQVGTSAHGTAAAA